MGNLVDTLKIGDRVQIDFLYLGRIRWMTCVTPLSKPADRISSSGEVEEVPPMAFRVSGLRSIRIGRERAMGLAVRKGRLSWTFVIPLVANPEPGKGKPENVSDPEIVKLARQYLPGEEVCVDYQTDNYSFAIKSLSPPLVGETGRVVCVGDKGVTNGRLGMQNVACPQLTALGKKGTRFLLVRPDDATGPGLPSAQANLADMVKGLTKDQVVYYKYYRQAGRRWLVEAQVIEDNQTASTK